MPDVTGAVNAYTSSDPALRASNGHASLIVVMVAKDTGMMGQNMAVDDMRAVARARCPARRSGGRRPDADA